MSLDELKIKSFLETQLVEDGAGFQTLKLAEIMDHKWQITLKQAGVQKDQCVDIYGIDGSVMESIDFEFYFAGEHLTDPLGLNSNYQTKDISRMLVDLEDHSTTSKPTLDLDSEKIMFEGL